MGGETSSRVASSYPKLSAGPVGQQIQGIYVDRIRQFSSTGQYEKENLLAFVHFQAIPLQGIC
jgi:alpha-mannosidase